MYLIARLELSYAGVMDFIAVAPKVREKMEAQGCKMLHAMMLEIGRLNTVMHIWEVADANAYFNALEALKQDPEFPDIIAVLAKAVVDETLSLASDLPYGPR